MRPLTVVGLTSDGLRLVLRSGNDTFELALRDVPTSRQPALPFTDAPPPSPRQIQERIRAGESSAQIAESTGVALEKVVKYEGPPLAEREHQAERAQRARVEGRLVGELVAEHMARMAQDPDALVWDAWLTEPGRWQVRAECGREAVRLSWQPATLKVQALDEPARQALRLGPITSDALGAVLRPVSSRPAPPPPVAAVTPLRPPPVEVVDDEPVEEPSDVLAVAVPPELDEAETGEPVPPAGAPEVAAAVAPPAPAAARKPPRRQSGRKRAAVPAWDDITAGVSGRGPQQPGS